MNRVFKISLCAVLITALSFCTAFNIFARESDKTSSDYVYSYVFGDVSPPSCSVTQYDGNSGAEKKISFTDENNVGFGTFDFGSFGLDLPSTGTGMRAFPLVFEPFYNFASPYNSFGNCNSVKSFSIYDLSYIQAYGLSFEFYIAYGMQSSNTHIDSLYDYSVGFFLDDGSPLLGGKTKITDEEKLTRYMFECKVGGNVVQVPFDLKLYKVEFTFNDATLLSDIHSENIHISFNFMWEGLPTHYLRLFSCITPVAVSYVTQENIDIYDELVSNEDEQKDLQEAESAVDDYKEKVDDIVDKLDTPKPSDGDIDDVLEGIDVESITVIGDIVSIDTDGTMFGRFIVSVSVSVLGVAFIGYVLHGKRG